VAVSEALAVEAPEALAVEPVDLEAEPVDLEV
jgi:hypothetical protein